MIGDLRPVGQFFVLFGQYERFLSGHDVIAPSADEVERSLPQDLLHTQRTKNAVGMEFARSVVNDRILDFQRVRIERIDRGRIARADHHFVIFVGQRRRIRRGDAFALPAERQRSLSQRECGIVILERRGADRGLHHVETLEREHRTLGGLA